MFCCLKAEWGGEGESMVPGLFNGWEQEHGRRFGQPLLLLLLRSLSTRPFPSRLPSP